MSAEASNDQLINLGLTLITFLFGSGGVVALIINSRTKAASDRAQAELAAQKGRASEAEQYRADLLRDNQTKTAEIEMLKARLGDLDQSYWLLRELVNQALAEFRGMVGTLLALHETQRWDKALEHVRAFSAKLTSFKMPDPPKSGKEKGPH